MLLLEKLITQTDQNGIHHAREEQHNDPEEWEEWYWYAWNQLEAQEDLSGK